MFCAAMTSRICQHYGRVNGNTQTGEKKGTNALLESEQVTLREGIRLGNDGNEVNAGTETLHDLDVKRLETVDNYKKP
jgi:hypothetical protein